MLVQWRQCHCIIQNPDCGIQSNPVVPGESLRTSLLVNGNRSEASPKECTDSQEEEEEEPGNSQGQQTAIPQGQSRMSAAYSLGE